LNNTLLLTIFHALHFVLLPSAWESSYVFTFCSNPPQFRLTSAAIAPNLQFGYDSPPILIY